MKFLAATRVICTQVEGDYPYKLWCVSYRLLEIGISVSPHYTHGVIPWGRSGRVILMCLVTGLIGDSMRIRLGWGR